MEEEEEEGKRVHTLWSPTHTCLATMLYMKPNGLWRGEERGEREGGWGVKGEEGAVGGGGRRRGGREEEEEGSRRSRRREKEEGDIQKHFQSARYTSVKHISQTVGPPNPTQ